MRRPLVLLMAAATLLAACATTDVAPSAGVEDIPTTPIAAASAEPQHPFAKPVAAALVRPQSPPRRIETPRRETTPLQTLSAANAAAR